MDAYGVFAGGGVKGAALAGAYAAATVAGLKFRGFGGTSAGSIVSLLAAIGYDVDELKEEVVGKPFTHAFQCARRVRALTQMKPWFTGEWKHFLHPQKSPPLRWPMQAAASWSIFKRLGIENGNGLRHYLGELISRKLLIDISEASELTFTQLSDRGIQFRVVATDITRGKPVVWPRDCDEYGDSVVDAVVASASFPFVFQPLSLGDAQVLDGGMASNLPSFLFSDCYAADRTPTIAFDLVPTGLKVAQSAVDVLWQCVGSCISVSDVLLRESSRGIKHIPIPIDSSIGTFDLNMERNQRETLYHVGFEAATISLRDYEPLATTKLAGDELGRMLMARFGPPDYFAPILRALARDFEDKGLQNVRSHITLPTNRNTRIVVYQYGMDNDPDRQLEIRVEAGCTGVAWTSRRASVADLRKSAANPHEWGMTVAQHQLVPTTQQAMLAVPIGDGDGGLPPIGTLAVDTATKLADTGWMDAEDKIMEIPAKLLLQWSRIIERMIP